LFLGIKAMKSILYMIDKKKDKYMLAHLKTYEYNVITSMNFEKNKLIDIILIKSTTSLFNNFDLCVLRWHFFCRGSELRLANSKVIKDLLNCCLSD